MCSLFSDLKNTRGFSLVEMAIVLLILGVVSSVSLSFLGNLRSTTNLKETLKKQKILMTILARHKKKYGHFPCPGRPDSQGKSRSNCPGMTLGIIPYADLGLSRQDAMDGYHHYFTYGLANPGALQPRGPRYPPSSIPLQRFEILTYTPIDQSPERRFADVILLSHGKNRYGAYQENGQRLPSRGVIGPHEYVNADDTPIFVDHPISHVDYTYHDDLLVAEALENIEAKYGRE